MYKNVDTVEEKCLVVPGVYMDKVCVCMCCGAYLYVIGC